MRLIHGDCLDALATLPDCSVDSVVTDPPAGIAFMGKAWDGDRGGRDAWVAWLAERLTECLRVLKPGGHAVVWALPRTSGWTHRALEDAGFEVRDCLTHLFGQGFPKSLDVGKAIDKQRKDEIGHVCEFLRSTIEAGPLTRREIGEAFGLNPRGVDQWAPTPTDHSSIKRARIPTWDQWLRLRDLLGFGDEMDAEVWRLNGRKGTPGEAWEQREVIGDKLDRPGYHLHPSPNGVTWSGMTDSVEKRTAAALVTAPATAEAQQWDGWGTALKPSAEFWYLARKPLVGTVAGTVTTWGTGALNVDACRVAGKPWTFTHTDKTSRSAGVMGDASGARTGVAESHQAGRWPANTVISHNPDCADECSPGCAAAELDRQSGTVGSVVRHVQRSNHSAPSDLTVGWNGAKAAPSSYGDSGGASRFFPTFKYVAKPSTREKGCGLDDRNTPALRLRSGLTDDKRAYVVAELAKAGVKC